MRRPGSPVTLPVSPPSGVEPEELTDPVDRLVQARSPPMTTASRAARSACCRTSVDSSSTANTAQLRVRTGDPVHVLEAHGAHEAGPKTRRRDDRRGSTPAPRWFELGSRELHGEPRRTA
jgi:hypothetical protein